VVEFDASLLPYNEELLAFLRRAKREGRRIGLFTAADQSIADAVADHLGLFEVVRGSDGTTNLSAEAKLSAIREAFGDRFCYAGDGRVDRPIFNAAESVILVGAVERLRSILPQGKRVEAVFPKTTIDIKVWIKALRLQHWVKNSLVFVAPFLSLQSLSFQVATQVLLLFVLLGILASATYILNDLIDLSADRQHPQKRFRPFAAGVISARQGAIVASLMISASFGFALLMPIAIPIALACYLALTLCYSLVLKRMPMIDVVALAGLFTLRVLAGGLLLPSPISPWLLTFSMLFFLNLAMIKRYAELERVYRTETQPSRARGYTVRDLPILLATGVASGLSAIVIFMIYLINEQYPRDIYHTPSVLWGIMPVLLIWTLRIWHLSVHGQMHEDPVVFALKDRISLALGVTIGALIVCAWL